MSLPTIKNEQAGQVELALSAWTVEMWLNVGNLPGTEAILLERQIATTTVPVINYGFYLDSDGRLVARYDDGTGVNGRTELVGASRLMTGAWNHVAMTYDGGALKLFLNGKEDASLATSKAPVTHGPGFISQLAGVGYDGLMDDLKVWNYARSASELAADMAKLDDGTDAALVAYYRFDDCNLAARTMPGWANLAASARAADAQDWANDWANAAVLGADVAIYDLTASDREAL